MVWQQANQRQTLNTLGWQTTVQHWQLRDLICCGSQEDEVFLVNQNATFRCNTHTDEVKQEALYSRLPTDFSELSLEDVQAMLVVTPGK